MSHGGSPLPAAPVSLPFTCGIPASRCPRGEGGHWGTGTENTMKNSAMAVLIPAHLSPVSLLLPIHLVLPKNTGSVRTLVV